MSIHSNQARARGPSSSDGMAGSNPTYKTHVQRDGSRRSSTAPAGDGKRKKDLSVDGATRTTQPTKLASEKTTNANTTGFGDGHYTPNK